MTPRTAPALMTILIPVFALGPPGEGHSQTSATGRVYYRCGPDGRDLRDSPCPPDKPGTSAALPEDTVDPADLRAARHRAAQQARDTASLQRERERQEAQRPTGPAGIRDRAGAPVTRSSAASSAASRTPKPPKPKSPKAPKAPTLPKPAKPPKVAKPTTAPTAPRSPTPRDARPKRPPAPATPAD